MKHRHILQHMAYYPNQPDSPTYSSTDDDEQHAAGSQPFTADPETKDVETANTHNFSLPDTVDSASSSFTIPLLPPFTNNIPPSTTSPPSNAPCTPFANNFYTEAPNGIPFSWNNTPIHPTINQNTSTLDMTSMITPTISSPIGGTAPRRLKFECSLCHKGFSSRTRLVTHLNSRHLNIKPFICNGACGEPFW
jgi:hypothetical protein